MTTRIVLIVDKSGSMSHVTEDTIGGFNEYLKNLEGKPRVSAMLFDTDFKVLFQDKTPKTATRLTKQNYRPGGNTALLDAVGKTLSELEFPEGDKVLCVIQTDGQENSSHEFTSDQVKSLVKEKELEGWGFLYIGADQSAWANSASIGIAAGNTFAMPQGLPGEIKTFYSSTTNASNAYTYAADRGEHNPISFAVSSLNVATTKPEAKTNVWNK